MKLATCMTLSFGLLACSTGPTHVFSPHSSETAPPATLVELAATIRSTATGRVVIVTLTGSPTVGPIESGQLFGDRSDVFYQETTAIGSATITDDLGESMSGSFELVGGDGSLGQVVDAAGHPRSDWVVSDDGSMSPWHAHAQLPGAGTYAIFMYPDRAVSGRWWQIWAAPVTGTNVDGLGTQTGSTVATSSLRVSP